MKCVRKRGIIDDWRMRAGWAKSRDSEYWQKGIAEGAFATGAYCSSGSIARRAAVTAPVRIRLLAALVFTVLWLVH